MLRDIPTRAGIRGRPAVGRLEPASRYIADANQTEGVGYASRASPRVEYWRQFDSVWVWRHWLPPSPAEEPTGPRARDGRLADRARVPSAAGHRVDVLDRSREGHRGPGRTAILGAENFALVARAGGMFGLAPEAAFTPTQASPRVEYWRQLDSAQCRRQWPIEALSHWHPGQRARKARGSTYASGARSGSFVEPHRCKPARSRRHASAM